MRTEIYQTRDGFVGIVYDENGIPQQSIYRNTRERIQEEFLINRERYEKHESA